MEQKGLRGFFEQYLTKEPLFRDKKVLQTNYTPETISHRDNEINTIAKILAPCLREERPSNIFIYGKTGTGKTLCVKHITENVSQVAYQKNLPIKIIYVNCKLKKVADTEYRIIAHLAGKFGKTIPPTGLPTDEVYNHFFTAVDDKKQTILLILDEIDQLVEKAGGEVLYNFTRINEQLKNSQISFVGISNDLVFTEKLDPRIKSSLSEEEVLFLPYNALQLKDILNQRAEQAFNKDVLKAGVIEKCAAFAAREHGDARRALELLRVAGEIAERTDSERIEIKHIDKADEKIEKDRVIDIVSTQPKQFQATLYSILIVAKNKKDTIFTGEVYEIYKNICNKTALNTLTQRRVSDIIAELDMLGVINAKVISKGRYGRTREISLSAPDEVIPQIKNLLEEGLTLS